MRELYYCRHGITDDLENGIRWRSYAAVSPADQTRFFPALRLTVVEPAT